MVEGLSSADGAKFLMRLESIGGRRFLRKIEPIRSEPQGARISLLIGLLKAEQFDAVLRASSELGVSEIFPVLCERSVPRLGSDDAAKKMPRWQRILDEGSKVAGLAVPARIHPPRRFDDFGWDSLPHDRYAAMLRHDSHPISNAAPMGPDVAFAVGPEGDWSDDEAEFLLSSNFLPVSLGSGILRSSTAAIVGCGWFRMSCST
jgi:16S rRNA (uracil1498-N3)-methyltransferase